MESNTLNRVFDSMFNLVNITIGQHLGASRCISDIPIKSNININMVYYTGIISTKYAQNALCITI